MRGPNPPSCSTGNRRPHSRRLLAALDGLVADHDLLLGVTARTHRDQRLPGSGARAGCFSTSSSISASDMARLVMSHGAEPAGCRSWSSPTGRTVPVEVTEGHRRVASTVSCDRGRASTHRRGLRSVASERGGGAPPPRGSRARRKARKPYARHVRAWWSTFRDRWHQGAAQIRKSRRRSRPFRPGTLAPLPASTSFGDDKVY